MNKSIKWSSHPLLTGTAVLTATGLASRIIGFLYRIFLTHTIGATGLGIYQLVFPIFTLCLALCAGGIQTAITKYTAEEKNTSVFFCGAGICLILSTFCSGLLYRYAPWLATQLIAEPDCAPLLRIISFSLPFACMHACFNGYYFGEKKTAVPAVSQLLEQVARVCSVYLFYRIRIEQQQTLTPALAMWGSVCGEIAAFLFCLTTFHMHRARPQPHTVRRIVRFAAPLTGSRVTLNLFASVEAILLPQALVLSGLSREDALSGFGTLTGMALPMILLPTVLTGSLSVLLLPAVSEAAAEGNRAQISRTILRTIELCVILGLGCTLIFLLFGHLMGTLLFHSPLAGAYITSLGFLCPFLFLAGTLNSILHGLELTMYTFLMNLSTCGLRLLAIRLLVPHFGLYAYLWSMLLSQILLTATYLWKLWNLRGHSSRKY